MADMRQQVRNYLDTRKNIDSAFAEKMNNPRKSFDNCMKFIALEAYKYMQEHKDDYKCDNGYCGDIDDEICYGWANHYYEENNLEIDKTDEEKKAEREAEAKKREDERKAQASTKKADKKPTTTKTAKTKSATKILETAKKKEEKKPTEKKLPKSELKKGNDCFDLFSDFFS